MEHQHNSEYLGILDNTIQGDSADTTFVVILLYLTLHKLILLGTSLAYTIASCFRSGFRENVAIATCKC
jgi:hypothetical protein